MVLAFINPKKAVRYLLDKGKYQGNRLWLVNGMIGSYRPGSCVINFYR